MQSFGNFLLVLIIFCTAQNSYAVGLKVAENDLVTLKADLIKYEDNSETLAANGNVYVSMGPYILRADSLYYDIKKDVLFAEGNIRIKDEQGRIATGQRAVLKDKLKKALRQWEIYRSVEGINIFSSGYYFLHYAIKALFR